MTFLELCQDLVRKAGISGSLVSVDGQSGEALRVVNWIAEAYQIVQSQHSDWTFLRTDVAFGTIAGNTYMAAAAGVTEFGEWHFAGGWRCYQTALGFADEQQLRYMQYDEFRNRYMYGANRDTTGRPLVVTERPDQSLVLWPTPDAAYTIVGEQHRAPHNFVANADVPLFAAKYHRVIVYRALMFYAEYEGDATTFAAAQSECARLIGMMEGQYLPEWELPGTLA